MGCAESKNEFKTYEPGILAKYQAPTATSSPTKSSKRFVPLETSLAREAIRKDDKFLVKQLLKTLDPTKGLEGTINKYNCLQLAAQYNSYKALTLMIHYLQKRNKNLEESLLKKSSDGSTLHELCIKNKSMEALGVLDLAAPLTGNKALSTSVRALELRTSSKRSRLKVPGTDITLVGVNANSKLYKSFLQLLPKQEKFVDHDFQSILGSICEDENVCRFKDQILWKRAEEIFAPNEVELFGNVSPNDVNQGDLGDCYFLTALASTAEYPERLRSIFLNESANAYGLYGVRLYLQGIPTEIILDDSFPCSVKTGQPIFTRLKPETSPLWVFLAEKAWAKVNKTYETIVGGARSEAFENLLGCPAISYDNEEFTHEALGKFLLENDRKRYLMTAGRYANSADLKGLIPGHAYSILEVVNSKVLRTVMIKIRNPWGHTEWTGDYSDESPKVTPELAEELSLVKENDGIFWMTLQDFKMFFDGFTVAFYEEGWKYNYLRLKNSEKTSIKFSVNETTKISFRLHQRDRRSYSPSERMNHRYAEVEDFSIYRKGTFGILTLLTRDKEDDCPNDTRSVYYTRRNVKIFERGEYVIKIRINSFMKGESFVVSSYSDKDVKMIEL